MMNKATACAVPLHQLIVDADGTCRLCTHHASGLYALRERADPSPLKQAIISPLRWHQATWREIWDSHDAADIRDKQANGTWPEACDACKRDELRGQQSHRQQVAKQQSQNGSQWANKLGTLVFDVGEINDVRHMLGASESSRPLRWEREMAFWFSALPEADPNHLAMPKWIANSLFNSHYDLWCGVNFPGTVSILVNPDTYSTHKPTPLSWLHSDISQRNLRDLAPRLHKVLFTGGDPLLIPDLSSTMDTLGQYCSDQCDIGLTTMLTQWPQDLMDSIGRLPNCRLNVIIEGHGDLDEWMRYQTHWHMTTELLDRLCQYHHIKITVNTHVTALNVQGLPDLLEWLHNVSSRHQKLITWTPLMPRFDVFHPCILPHKTRMDLVDRMQAWRSNQSTQWPFYCWDGIDMISKILANRPKFDASAASRLVALLDYQEALRSNPVLRKWLGFGSEPDWQDRFPALCAALRSGE